MSVFMFPGLGAHSPGMGKELFAAYPEQIKIADQVLGYSIQELCLEDPQHLLENTEYVQPALFIVCMMFLWNHLSSRIQEPDFLLGHSMGETCALCYAGAFDFATGVWLSKQRGRLMSKVANGAMAVIIGFDEEMVRGTLVANQLRTLDIANLNSHSQVVISGSSADIIAAQSLFTKADGIYVQLAVDKPYHSRYMKEIRDEFYEILKDVPFAPLKIPVIANVNGRPYMNHQIKETFADQVDHCVRWKESIEFLLALSQTNFEEIGPGNVLNGFLRQIKKEWGKNVHK